MGFKARCIVGLIDLVYVSYQSHPLTDDELREILKVARETNKTLDITGMLLYRDGFFIQALEGEAETVEKLYNKILQDPRHINVLVVSKESITDRAFSQWEMGFNKVTDSTLAKMEGFSDFMENPDASFFTDHPPRAKRLLETFREQIYF
jgi:Sensors of blue-light using FAD